MHGLHLQRRRLRLHRMHLLLTEGLQPRGLPSLFQARRYRSMSLRLLSWCATGVLVASSASAVDPFEIQVYDGTANEAGAVGLELHINRVVSGLRSATPPELPLSHQTHLTLEPSFGAQSWWEIGGYFQSTLRPDGVYDFSGVKLRSKFVVPEGTYEHLRLGINLELSRIPERYEAGRWGAEVRPILAWENRYWFFATNPILTFGLEGLGDGPDFEPAAAAKIKLFDTFALGFEYYAALGRVADPLPADEQSHFLYETLDLFSLPRVEVNFGLGEGLTAASSQLVAKLILGYAWEG